ncbi:hypothetical protein PTTG_26535 [Puccinia triticina 1-1 BBBD Race 1]|uniref:Uncharacterized protein n=1 Tax=Puccinia triticina (isolate 1-1 / race 1 (BBBD)) TaxID=630390 RepID=A0A180GTF3_PUCT1|nr:hypothetical protein PTTG_26535 [Puccinia triticina 1-1 BBBD Race 1]
MEDPTAISISSDSSAPINTNASPIAPPSSAPGMDLDKAIAQPVPAPVGRSIRQLEREIFGRSLSPQLLKFERPSAARRMPYIVRLLSALDEVVVPKLVPLGAFVVVVVVVEMVVVEAVVVQLAALAPVPFLISNRAMINPTLTPPPAARASTPRVDPDHPLKFVPSPIPFGLYDVDNYHRLAPHQVEALLDRRPDFGQYDQYRFAPQAYTVFYQELASAMVSHFAQYPAANALERDGRVQLFRFASHCYRAAMRRVPF